MVNLPIMQQSPNIALFFGLVAVTTSALLLAILGGIIIPQIVLIVLGIFWMVTGMLALWSGYKYSRMRQQL